MGHGLEFSLELIDAVGAFLEPIATAARCAAAYPHAAVLQRGASPGALCAGQSPEMRHGMLPVCGIVLFVLAPGAAGELRCTHSHAVYSISLARSRRGIIFLCVWLDQSAGFSCMTGVRAADCDSQHAKAPAASAPIGIAARGGTATQTTFPTNGARSSATSRFPAFALRCLRAVWLPALIFTNARVRAHHAV
jgi:hypothetical protein